MWIVVTSPIVYLPESARDAYELASDRGITPEAAADAQRRECWKFVGYNDYGQEAFVPPSAIEH